jgi:hypothetical protein
MRNQPRAMKFRNRSTVLSGALLVSIVLTGCGAEKLTPEQAAAEPCATFQKYIDSFLASDLGAAAIHAELASKQFADVASIDFQFGRFSRVMKGAMDDGIVDDLGGYVKLLPYCREINKTTE